MAQMNMVQAINSAMDIMLNRDPDVVLMGEDIGYFGGVFRCTEGLQRKYGDHRVLDTPIAEGGILGAAIGMGVNGLRPVVEIQFADYIYPAFDQLTSTLARLRYRSGGDFWSPVTIRTPCGGGIRGGQTHSQSPEGIFTHVCGIKVVMPSNPYDAKGLLISSIEDDDPVVFFEPKRLYNGPFDGDPNKPAVPWSTQSERRSARRLLHGADRQSGNRPQRRRRDGADLRHAGARGRSGGAESEDRCGDHRRAHDGAARRRHDLHVGEEDRAAAWSRTKRPGSADSALNCRPPFRSNASGRYRRRSSASPVGIRRIRTCSSGITFPGQARMIAAFNAVMEASV